MILFINILTLTTRDFENQDMGDCVLTEIEV